MLTLAPLTSLASLWPLTFLWPHLDSSFLPLDASIYSKSRWPHRSSFIVPLVTVACLKSYQPHWAFSILPLITLTYLNCADLVELLRLSLVVVWRYNLGYSPCDFFSHMLKIMIKSINGGVELIRGPIRAIKRPRAVFVLLHNGAGMPRVPSVIHSNTT